MEGLTDKCKISPVKCICGIKPERVRRIQCVGRLVNDVASDEVLGGHVREVFSCQVLFEGIDIAQPLYDTLIKKKKKWRCD